MFKDMDPATRRHLDALRVEHAEKEKALESFREELIGMRQRSGALIARRRAEAAPDKTAADASIDAMAANLAADPAAALGGAQLASAVRAQAVGAKAAAERDARLAALDVAIDRIAPTIADIEATVARLEREQDKALSTLLAAVHQALFDEASRRFRQTVDELIVPMLAIAEHPAVRSATLSHIEQGSVLELKRWVYNATRGGTFVSDAILRTDSQCRLPDVSLTAEAIVAELVAGLKLEPFPASN
ncbi:MAG: hypothetical protein ACRYHC_10795 [Janthinobacterium lividum]